MVKEGYQQTEVGVMPADWKVVDLGSVAKVRGGGTPSTTVNEFWNGSIEWFTPTEIGKSKYVKESIRKITKLGLENSSAQILPTGAILMTTRASIGDLAILTKPASTNQGFQSIIPEKIDNQYAYYILSSLSSELMKNASGSTFLEVSPNKVKALKIPLPPTLNEQTAIATALSDMDALISKLDALILKKKAIKKGAMQLLLKPPIDGEIRSNSFEGKWDEITIEKLSKTFTKQTGFDYSNHIKPTLVNKKRDNVLPFIQNKDFDGGWVNFDTDYFIPEEVAVRFPMILLNEQCLLISISGSIGKVGVFNNKQMAFIGGAVAVAKFIDLQLLTWVMYYLQSEQGQNRMLKDVKAGSHQNLILDDIRKIMIPIPPPKERQRIISILNDMGKEIESLEAKKTKCIQLKQGMAQELLTGKIRLV
ncbi:MAG: restriction endonuclease subunit S [Carboxylicivirga sp.]|jgi:restriction endonuclease S subunit|nr:restriction endonuclease subunit S [Carboxylicivirga sp.]